MASFLNLWENLSGIDYPTYNTSFHLPIIDGQSLALGYQGAGAFTAEFLDRPGLRQLDGLKRSDGIDMPIEGPRSLTYGPETATGLKYPDIVSVVPASLTFAAALDKWRQKLGRSQYQMIVGFNGFPGRPIFEFDDDDPAVTGGNGTHIRDNHIRWIQEVLSQKPDIYPIVYGMIQGEADKGLAPETYYSRATESYNDALDDIETLTGTRPPLILWQTGGYTNSPSQHPYGSTLAQLDLVKDFNGIFAGPLYPGKLRDNVIHPDLESQIIWSEIGAWVFAHYELGQDMNMLPGTPEVVGDTITIPFNINPQKSLTFDNINKYAQYGGLQDHGIEISNMTIKSVALNKDKVIIQANGPVSGRTVQIAMQAGNVENFSDSSNHNYGTHRCDIIESAPEDSLLLPGVKLRRYIPSVRFDL